MAEFASVDPDNLLLQRADCGFTEVGSVAKLNLPTQGRGALIADFNVDGLLDLMVINREAPVSVFRNLGARSASAKQLGNWLAIELYQSGANRQGVGARIEIKTSDSTQIRTVSVGGGHAAGTNGFVHIGLGEAKSARVRVRWPDGSWSEDYSVLANRHAVLARESSVVSYWSSDTER